jgi:hypothetical protein
MAGILKQEKARKGNTKGQEETIGRLARSMALAFGLENPRFQPSRFFQACGLNSEGR